MNFRSDRIPKKEWEKKYRYLNRVFVRLKREKKLENTNPAKMSREDIGAFIQWAREEQKLQGATTEKYLRLLEHLTNYIGNPVFVRMRAEGEQFPRRAQKGIISLNEEQVSMVMQASEHIKGWYGEVARFITAMYPFTGTRPSELRLAEITDIDTKRWTLFIRSPKGEGEWARQRTELILPPARPAVLRFLKARKAKLRGLGLEEAVPLMPAFYNGKVKHYSATRLRRIKSMVQEWLPNDFPDFSLKTFRASFCQMNLDRDPNLISDVSYAMGHSTTRTTETFYGRIKQDKALERIQKAWEGCDAKNPLIDRKYEPTGYN